VNSSRGRYMKGKSQSAVEPVFGTLTQFMGISKTITLSLVQANKVIYLSAMAYNLKKYLEVDLNCVKSGAARVAMSGFRENLSHWFETLILSMKKIKHMEAYN